MRLPVDLGRAHRLLNHGPTVLICAAHGAHRDIMTASWVSPLSTEPPRLTVALEKGSFTRELIEASNRFAISIPSRAQVRMVTAAGRRTGRDDDKITALQVPLLQEPAVSSPMVGGCLAWLDCERIVRRKLEAEYDLFLADIRGAWAESRVFINGRWQFSKQNDAMRTLHHVADGQFFEIGDPVEGR